MLDLKAFPPSAGLQPIVQRYVHTTAQLPEGLVFDYLLIPALSEVIYFNLNDQPQLFIMKDGVEVLMKDCVLGGQYSHSFQTRFRGNVNLLGIHMNTPALSQLFGINMRPNLDNAILLEKVIGKEASKLLQEMRQLDSIGLVIERLEVFLTKMLEQSTSSDFETVRHSLLMIKGAPGTITVKQLAASNNISERTLQKIFSNQVGLTPKEYIRIFRLNEVINTMNDDTFSWKYVVETLGYFDQSHFLNDFKSIVGKTPSEYYVNHPTINRFFTEFIKDSKAE
ncbi:MAG: AraC family transcriptional regulator [Bacteroidota bacterium]